MKVGLFFGSFNPIHIGHLIIANTIKSSYAIDQVWFVVSPLSPFKKKKSLLHHFDRIDLINRAIDDNSGLKTCDIEFNLPQPNYTVHTLALLGEKYPQHVFSLIMGQDNLEHFGKWKNHEVILEHHQLFVFPRPGAAKSEWEQHEKIIMTNAPYMDISASYIREKIKADISIKYLVHDEVAQQIKIKKYYL